MLYSFLRVPATWVLRVYFRRIYIEGVDHIPQDKGTLIVSNHPNAFLEACLMACFQPHVLYFLVRGDVFMHPAAIALLRGTHQIPIYRFRDGFANLRRNAKSFRESYDVLKRGDKLLIFGEATTHFARRLRPVQRGTARILRGVTKRHPEQQYCVVPAGVHFSDPERLRSSVSIRFGESLDVNRWTPIENQNEALDRLTSDIEAKMRKELIHIPEDVWEDWMEYWLHLMQNEEDSLDPGHRVLYDTDGKNRKKVQVRQYLDAPEQTSLKLKHWIEEYRIATDREDITDREVQIGSKEKMNHLAEYVLGWPFYILGKWCNVLPLFLADHYARRLAPKREFIASMKLALILLLYPVYFIILIVLALVLFSHWGWMVISIPFLGVYALRHEDIQLYHHAKNKWGNLPTSVRFELRTLREQIISFHKTDASDE